MQTAEDVSSFDSVQIACLRRRTRRLLLVSACLLLAAAAALPVDVPVGRWCTDDRCPSWLARVFDAAEPFGHGLGVALILTSICLLDPARRWAIPRVLTVAAASGLAADAIKLLVVRVRPYHFDFQGTVWSTFGDWLPLGSAGNPGQSFPSGHTATAVGLAIALVWLYPRGRWLFPTLAALVACQRVETGAHWPSDVLAAAAVGCLVALVCLDIGPIPRAFDRWESRWRRMTDGQGAKNQLLSAAYCVLLAAYCLLPAAYCRVC